MSDSSFPTEPGTEPEYCAYTTYEYGESPPEFPATGENARGPEQAVWKALYGVEDPEMPISVVDLGLIYGVERDGDHVTVEMTLTYTGCPAREMLLDDVRNAVERVEGVERCDVCLVWSPEWSIDCITEHGKRQLQEFGVSVP